MPVPTGQTVNKYLLDRSVQHQLLVIRHGNGNAREISKILEEAQEDLLKRLNFRLSQISKRGGVDLGPEVTRRMREVNKVIGQLSKEMMRDTRDQLSLNLKELAQQETAYQQGLLSKALPVAVDTVVPTASTLNAIIGRQPFDGMPLTGWFDKLAKDQQTRLLQAVRNSTVQGETIDQLARRIRGTAARGFKDGIFETSRRNAQAIARTATLHTSNQVRQAYYAENSDLVTGLQWVATLDTRTCPVCMGLDGKVYDVDEGPRPPYHVNCLPGNALVTTSDRILAATKRAYDGDLIVLRTAFGHKLSCTPNHPILTDLGWLPAKLLNTGRQVVSRSGRDGITRSDRSHQHMPARIEEIAEAFLNNSQVSSVPVPTTGKDFHGDGMNGQIAVIGTDRELHLNLEATLHQQTLEEMLIGRSMGLSLVARLRPLDSGLQAALASPHLRMSSLRPGLPLLRACPVHAELLGVGAAARSNAMLTQDPQRHLAGDAIVFGQGLDALAAGEFLDQLVGVDVVHFSGHVYNLQTESGRYTANNIANHNCRCTMSPVLKSWKSLGFDVGEADPGTRASMDGQVPDTLTYNGWLRERVAAGDMDTVNEALGPTRAKAFAKNKLQVSNFVDRQGRTLTLEELGLRDPS